MTVLIMNPMQRALYFVVSKNEPATWKHYALSIAYYTHFTSPIRRYADVMVHRLLEEGLLMEEKNGNANVDDGRVSTVGGEATGKAGSGEGAVVGFGNGNNTPITYDKNRILNLSMIAAQCNDRKEASGKAQERSDEVYLAVYLLNNPMVTEAVVIGIGDKSFTGLILDFSLDERFYIDRIEGVDAEYIEEERKHILTRRPPSALPLPGAPQGAQGNQQQQGQGRGGQERGGQGRGRGNAAMPAPGRGHGQGQRPGGVQCNFARMEITLMSKVMVRLTANTTPPISVRVELLGPA
jgi:hypothetical protein